MKSLNETISFNWGIHDFLLCLAADTIIRSRRSFLTTRRSENLQFRKDNSSKPISVIFSVSHSILSIFFVGAIAK